MSALNRPVGPMSRWQHRCESSRFMSVESLCLSCESGLWSN